MFNSFGNIFRLTSFGESHGPGVGGVIDGFPAGIKVDMDFVQQELNRRVPDSHYLPPAARSLIQWNSFQVYSKASPPVAPSDLWYGTRTNIQTTTRISRICSALHTQIILICKNTESVITVAGDVHQHEKPFRA